MRFSVVTLCVELRARYLSFCGCFQDCYRVVMHFNHLKQMTTYSFYIASPDDLSPLISSMNWSTNASFASLCDINYAFLELYSKPYSVSILPLGGAQTQIFLPDSDSGLHCKYCAHKKIAITVGFKKAYKSEKIYSRQCYITDYFILI